MYITKYIKPTLDTNWKKSKSQFLEIPIKRTELLLFPVLLIMMLNQNSSLTEGASTPTLDVRLFISSLYVLLKGKLMMHM